MRSTGRSARFARLPSPKTTPSVCDREGQFKIGNARIKEYQTALKFVRGLLQVEPGNRQAQELEAIIKKKMEKEGLIGMAVVGGATLALGGLVGLGIALAKSSKS